MTQRTRTSFVTTYNTADTGNCSCINNVECVVDLGMCVSNPCPNGAECIDVSYGYTCECVGGFVDNNCETSTSVYMWYSYIYT